MSTIDGFPKADELSKIRIDSQEYEYLCVFDDEKMILNNAMSCEKDVVTGHFANYLRRYNIGKTEEIFLRGQATFTQRKLTRQEKIDYMALLAKMNEAFIYALAYWENDVFDKICEEE